MFFIIHKVDVCPETKRTVSFSVAALILVVEDLITTFTCQATVCKTRQPVPTS